MRPWPLLFLLAVLLLPAGPGGAAPAPVPVKAAPPAKSMLLRDDPFLQQKVTLEATGRPLGDVLKDLSLALKADLTASSAIADQRVTLRLTDQPVYLLLNRLPQLLSHDPDHPRGYYWEKQRPASGRPAFNLWRDLRSVQDEDSERDYPRQEAAKMLRDLRAMAGLTPEQRGKYKGDYRYPLNPQDAGEMALAKALRGLTDGQVEALLDGQKITLDPAAFPEELAACKKRERDEWKHDQELDRLILGTERFPKGLPAQPDFAPVLSVTRTDCDGEHPDDATRYSVGLSCLTHQGHLDSLAVLDPYDTVQSRGPWPPAGLSPVKAPLEAVIDLAPLLSEKAATPAQRSDLGFTLQAPARAAHLTLYHEAFLKPPAPFTGLAQSLPALRGTLPQIIEAVEAGWNCRSQTVGGDYLFWDRTWAQDRAADIPDSFLQKWRARLQKQQGLFQWEDRAAIAGALTWPQMGVTLKAAFPEGCCQSVGTFKMWHLLGSLDAQDRASAFSPLGVPLGDLSPSGREALASGFAKELAQTPGEQLDTAVLSFRVEPSDPALWRIPNEQVAMSVRADDKPLFGAGDIVFLEAPPLPAPASRP